MATVRWHLDELTGASLTLRLYPLTSGSIANDPDEEGGDAMTEAGDGLFSATVAESLTGWHKAYADESSQIAASGFVNMSEASPVVVENVVDIAAALAPHGYVDGFVYLDPVNGSAGTTVNVNGTINNPANSLANAIAIATARGLLAIKLAVGANVTVPNGDYFLQSFTVDLNGGSLTPETVAGVNMDSWTFVTSIYPGSLRAEEGLSGETPLYYAHYHDVRVIGNCFIPSTTYMVGGRFNGNIRFDGTLSSADSVFVDCYNESATAMTWDMNGGTNQTGAVLTGWWGDLIVANLAAGQTFQVYGYGKLTIADSCTGGTVRHTSHVEVVNEDGDTYTGAVTLDLVSEGTGLTTSDVVDALETYDGPTKAEMDAAIAGIPDLFGGYSVTVVSPIDQSGRLRIAAGDDYTDESGNALTFTIEGEIPDLTGATITLTIRHKDHPTDTPIVGTGSLTSQAGDTAVIKVEIPRTQTINGRTYAGSNWWYDLQATLTDGTVRTLKGPQAPCTVLLDQTQ